MLNKCIWENCSSRALFTLFIADEIFFFQQYFMIKILLDKVPNGGEKKEKDAVI